MLGGQVGVILQVLFQAVLRIQHHAAEFQASKGTAPSAHTLLDKKQRIFPLGTLVDNRVMLQYAF